MSTQTAFWNRAHTLDDQRVLACHSASAIDLEVLHVIVFKMYTLNQLGLASLVGMAVSMLRGKKNK